MSDVQASASVERDDFAFEPRSLELAALLFAARSYAESLPGYHPVGVRIAEGYGDAFSDSHARDYAVRDFKAGSSHDLRRIVR